MLQRFVGSTSGQVGCTPLVQKMLQLEAAPLKAPQAKACSLIIDKMRSKPSLQYLKQKDAFIGEVDLGPQHECEDSGQPVLANSLLCFILNGLSVHLRIPVGYFST